MLVELTSNKPAELNKWFKVRTINGEVVSEVYVRFVFVYDNNGIKLYKLPATETPIYVELEYNGYGYP